MPYLGYKILRFIILVWLPPSGLIARNRLYHDRRRIAFRGAVGLQYLGIGY